MPATCILDSSVIIDVVNGRNDRAKLLTDLMESGTLLACCPINITEVHMGMRPSEADRTGALLDSLEFYPITPEIAKYAGALYREHRRKGQTLSLPDLTIAAVVIVNKLQLATDNQKDFPMPGLKFYPLP